MPVTNFLELFELMLTDPKGVAYSSQFRAHYSKPDFQTAPLIDVARKIEELFENVDDSAVFLPNLCIICRILEGASTEVILRMSAELPFILMKQLRWVAALKLPVDKKTLDLADNESLQRKAAKIDDQLAQYFSTHMGASPRLYQDYMHTLFIHFALGSLLNYLKIKRIPDDKTMVRIEYVQDICNFFFKLPALKIKGLFSNLATILRFHQIWSSADETAEKKEIQLLTTPILMLPLAQAIKKCGADNSPIMGCIYIDRSFQFLSQVSQFDVRAETIFLNLAANSMQPFVHFCHEEPANVYYLIDLIIASEFNHEKKLALLSRLFSALKPIPYEEKQDHLIELMIDLYDRHPNKTLVRRCLMDEFLSEDVRQKQCYISTPLINRFASVIMKNGYFDVAFAFCLSMVKTKTKESLFNQCLKHLGLTNLLVNDAMKKEIPTSEDEIERHWWRLVLESPKEMPAEFFDKFHKLFKKVIDRSVIGSHKKISAHGERMISLIGQCKPGLNDAKLTGNIQRSIDILINAIESSSLSACKGDSNSNISFLSLITNLHACKESAVSGILIALTRSTLLSPFFNDILLKVQPKSRSKMTLSSNITVFSQLSQALKLVLSGDYPVIFSITADNSSEAITEAAAKLFVVFLMVVLRDFQTSNIIEEQSSWQKMAFTLFHSIFKRSDLTPISQCTIKMLEASNAYHFIPERYHLKIKQILQAHEKLIAKNEARRIEIASLTQGAAVALRPSHYTYLEISRSCELMGTLQAEYTQKHTKMSRPFNQSKFVGNLTTIIQNPDSFDNVLETLLICSETELSTLLTVISLSDPMHHFFSEFLFSIQPKNKKTKQLTLEQAFFNSDYLVQLGSILHMLTIRPHPDSGSAMAPYDITSRPESTAQLLVAMLVLVFRDFKSFCVISEQNAWRHVVTDMIKQSLSNPMASPTKERLTFLLNETLHSPLISKFFNAWIKALLEFEKGRPFIFDNLPYLSDDDIIATFEEDILDMENSSSSAVEKKTNSKKKKLKRQDAAVSVTNPGLDKPTASSTPQSKISPAAVSDKAVVEIKIDETMTSPIHSETAQDNSLLTPPPRNVEMFLAALYNEGRIKKSVHEIMVMINNLMCIENLPVSWQNALMQVTESIASMNMPAVSADASPRLNYLDNKAYANIKLEALWNGLLATLCWDLQCEFTKYFTPLLTTIHDEEKKSVMDAYEIISSALIILSGCYYKNPDLYLNLRVLNVLQAIVCHFKATDLVLLKGSHFLKPGKNERDWDLSVIPNCIVTKEEVIATLDELLISLQSSGKTRAAIRMMNDKMVGNVVSSTLALTILDDGPAQTLDVDISFSLIPRTLKQQIDDTIKFTLSTCAVNWHLSPMLLGRAYMDPEVARGICCEKLVLNVLKNYITMMGDENKALYLERVHYLLINTIKYLGDPDIYLNQLFRMGDENKALYFEKGGYFLRNIIKYFGDPDIHLGHILKEFLKDYIEPATRINLSEGLINPDNIETTLRYLMDQEIIKKMIHYIFDHFHVRTDKTIRYLINNELLSMLLPLSRDLYLKCLRYFLNHFSPESTEFTAEITGPAFLTMFLLGAFIDESGKVISDRIPLLEKLLNETPIVGMKKVFSIIRSLTNNPELTDTIYFLKREAIDESAQSTSFSYRTIRSIAHRWEPSIAKVSVSTLGVFCLKTVNRDTTEAKNISGASRLDCV